MTVLLLVWQCTDRLDCTYGQVGIVKHDAGTLGISWVTNGALNMLRSPEMIAGMRDRPWCGVSR
jgi:hypothetical protein